VPSARSNDAVAAAAPQWFRDALAAPREQRFTTVDGCRVGYWRWGRPGRAGLLLVHGGGAHGHWWDHVAPFLVTSDRCVVAIDLSGHGDSGHRDLYSLDGWAAEMLAVADHAGMAARPVFAGHSLGGWATVVAAADHPEAVGGLILLDCRIIDPERGQPGAPEDRKPSRPPRVYATLEEVLQRYRPEPAQEDNLQYVIDHLAAMSVKRQTGGWAWKFDPTAIYQRRPGPEALGRVKCPVTIIRGERGLVTTTITEQMSRALGERAPVIDIPLAGHHLMLDHPLEVVTALRATLAHWAVLPGAIEDRLARQR
jgi:pimeloyl-ACP methyl ester carboxylesterase